MKIIPLLLLSLVMLSCGSTHYCYVVRHADKLDNTPYSVLSSAGHARSIVLKNYLTDKKIDIIFATPFQRTQETAQPLAQALNRSLLLYRNNAVDSIVTMIRSIKKKNILLVGHSGNIPSIIEGLTTKKIRPIAEGEYDNLYIIKTRKSKTELVATKY
ncbi:MAG: phosphoglycerate mutase family protein [Ferruginibacter sp.]